MISNYSETFHPWKTYVGCHVHIYNKRTMKIIANQVCKKNEMKNYFAMFEPVAIM